MLNVLKNIFYFIVLVLVQVLVLNNIQFLGFVNPYIYILFILSLPVRLPRWATLLLAFALGLTIDLFSNTLGLNAFATVFIAYIRDGIIKLFTSIEEGSNPVPSFRSFGVTAYIKYVAFMVVIHHTILFLLEAFSFAHIGFVLLRILLSSMISIILILGIKSLKKV